MNSQTRSAARATAVFAGAAALLLAGAPSARAQDNREEQLERRVEELERALTELRDSRTGSASSELEDRVAELEKASKLDKDGVFPYWKTGFRAEAADKKQFAFKFGGRIMNDYVMWSGDDDTEAVVGDSLTTSAEFRRARLFFEGLIYGNVIYKAQYDFEGGDASFKDVYMGLITKHGTFKVGHHHMPFGLEERTSSKYTTFMERAPHQVFGPSRKTGLSFSGGGDFGEKGSESGDYWWGAGVFRESDDFGNDTGNKGKGEWNWAARASARPWVDEDAESYFGVGASIAMYNYDDQDVRYRARPNVHTAPRFVDTGTFNADDGTAYELDAVFVSGPFHSMVEWMAVDADGGKLGTQSPNFDGMVIQAGYFLTGESRPWKNGNFDRISPKTNYGDEGSGAWEIAARFSTIDLDDGRIRGGDMDIWSIGVNWYLNPNTRVMLGYEAIDLDRDDGAGINAKDVEALMLRFQIDF